MFSNQFDPKEISAMNETMKQFSLPENNIPAFLVEAAKAVAPQYKTAQTLTERRDLISEGLKTAAEKNHFDITPTAASNFENAVRFYSSSN